MNFFLLVFNLMGQIFKNNKGKILFLWNIISSWYVAIYGAAIATAYYIFKGLKESGVYDKVFNFMTAKLDMIVNISRECSMHLGDLKTFFDCI